MKFGIKSFDAGNGIFRFGGSIPCLLMHWLLKSPVHQQASYCLCGTDNIYFCSRLISSTWVELKSKIRFKMWLYLLWQLKQFLSDIETANRINFDGKDDGISSHVFVIRGVAKMIFKISITLSVVFCCVSSHVFLIISLARWYSRSRSPYLRFLLCIFSCVCDNNRRQDDIQDLDHPICGILLCISSCVCENKRRQDDIQDLDHPICGFLLCIFSCVCENKRRQDDIQDLDHPIGGILLCSHFLSVNLLQEWRVLHPYQCPNGHCNAEMQKIVMSHGNLLEMNCF